MVEIDIQDLEASMRKVSYGYTKGFKSKTVNNLLETHNRSAWNVIINLSRKLKKDPID
jgi:hypothetical protein